MQEMENMLGTMPKLPVDSMENEKLNFGLETTRFKRIIRIMKFSKVALDGWKHFFKGLLSNLGEYLEIW